MEEEERESLQTDIARMNLALQLQGNDHDSPHTHHSGVDLDDSDVESDDNGPVSFIGVKADHDEEPTTSAAADTAEKGFNGESSVQDLVLDDDTELEESPAVCLAMNQAYQEVLTENLSKIHAAIEQNRLQQLEVELNLETQAEQRNTNKPNAGSKQRYSPFISPFFRDINNMFPSANEDAMMKRASEEPSARVKAPRYWSSIDKKRLRDAIKTDTLKRRIQPLMNRLDIEHSKREECHRLNDKSGIEEIENRVKALKEEMQSIKNSSDVEMQYGSLKEAQHIDWLKIATMDFKGRKSAVNCRLMWENAVHLLINTRRWTAKEDEQLSALSIEFNYSHWDTIALNLGTGRTAFQCLQRYQKNLNQMANEPWSKEEDQFLTQVVETIRLGSFINWVQVAFYVDGRSTDQCKERWEMTTHKLTQKGKWTDAEDLKLLEAVKRFGNKDYEKISAFVGTRRSAQCRERYVNSLQSTLRFGNWTYEEDRFLWLYVKEHGQKTDLGCSWKKVAEQLKGRTYNACFQRHKLMKRWEDENSILANIPERVGSLVSLHKAEENNYQLLPHEKSIIQALKDVVRRLLAGRALPLARSRRQSFLLSMQGEVRDLDIVPIKMAVQMGSEWGMRQRIRDIMDGKRAGREQLDCLMEQQELLQADIIAKLYIPRPVSDANRTRIQKRTRDEREQLHAVIRERINRALNKVKGGKLKKVKLDETIVCKNLPVRSQTVGQLLQAITKGKKEMVQMSLPKPMQPKRALCRQEVYRLDSLIYRMLKGRFCPANRLGRPRKMDSITTTLFEQPKEVSKTEIEKEINVLLFTALNLNKDEATKIARSRLAELGPAPPCPTEDVSAALKLSLLLKKLPSIDDIDHEPKDPRTKLLQDVEVLRCVSGDALDAPQSEDDPVEDNQDIGVDLRTSQRRKALPDSTEYRMAPLPPMCSSLYAFKTFLLQRKNLLKTAHNYHNAGTIDRSLKVHPDAVTIRHKVTSMEIVPGALPAVPVKDIIRTRQMVDACNVNTVVHSPQTAISRITESHDYQKLKGRFFSAFMWPAMLSAFEPPPKMTIEPSTTKKGSKTRYPYSSKFKGVNKKRKKVVQVPRERVVVEADPESMPVRPARGRPRGKRRKVEVVTVKRESRRLVNQQKVAEEKELHLKAELEAQQREQAAPQVLQQPHEAIQTLFVIPLPASQSHIVDLPLLHDGAQIIVDQNQVTTAFQPMETEPTEVMDEEQTMQIIIRKDETDFK